MLVWAALFGEPLGKRVDFELCWASQLQGREEQRQVEQQCEERRWEEQRQKEWQCNE